MFINYVGCIQFIVDTITEQQMDDILNEAASVLGFTELGEFQRKAAIAAFNGRDVFVAMPRGSGKSLAFQVLPFLKSEELQSEGFVLMQKLDKFRSEMKPELLQKRLQCVVVDESKVEEASEESSSHGSSACEDNFSISSASSDEANRPKYKLRVRLPSESDSNSDW
eukprot:gene8405-9305_t